jgi:hypothetical protein
VTLTFAALLGAGVAQSVSPRRVVRTVRGARFVTIILVAACGLVIWKGWEIAGFHLAQGRAQDRAEALSPWTSVSGVASYALGALVSALLEPINPQTVAHRLDEIGALLSVRPLASQHWLSLTAMRHLAGQHMEKVLAALRLSFSTEPNEGEVMLQRALLCLSVWEDLPAAKAPHRHLVAAAACAHVSARPNARAGRCLGGQPYGVGIVNGYIGARGQGRRRARRLLVLASRSQQPESTCSPSPGAVVAARGRGRLLAGQAYRQRAKEVSLERNQRRAAAVFLRDRPGRCLPNSAASVERLMTDASLREMSWGRSNGAALNIRMDVQTSEPRCKPRQGGGFASLLA